LDASRLAGIFQDYGVEGDALEGAETFARVTEMGLAAVEEDRRAACALAIAEAWGETKDLTLLGLLAWILDHCASASPDLADAARALRDLRFAPLRAAHPPPSVEAQQASGVWKTVPAGKFLMGSPPKEGGGEAERPQHRVAISAFQMLDHPVVNEDNVLKVGRVDRARLPIVQATWYEAYAFAAWLGGRLPTEAEWEYACRAGSKGRFAGGNTEAALDRVGWYLANGERQLQPVRKKEPNAFGLYDMHGNVWEWVADWFGAYPAADPAAAAAAVVQDPRGPCGGRGRVVRGGCVRDTASWVRAAYRKARDPEDRDRYVGFRVVLPLPMGSGSA